MRTSLNQPAQHKASAARHEALKYWLIEAQSAITGKVTSITHSRNALIFQSTTMVPPLTSWSG